MLLAYLDEVGETGAFVSKSHDRFHTSPAFGYAGFIVPEEHARHFSSIFVKEKKTRFARELAKAKDPAQFEAKGSDLFYWNTPAERPENLRIFCSLVRLLEKLDGKLFYYIDEKPLGTPKQTKFSAEVGQQREHNAMQETLNRIARYAHLKDSNIMVMIDSINEKQRAERVARMYQHIFSRSSHHQEMLRIIEPPMHIDSKLSSNIQFADWVAGYLTRAVERQLIDDSRCMWVGEHPSRHQLMGNFTGESKLHFYERAIEDLHHSQLISKERPLFQARVNTVGDSLNAKNIARMRQVAINSQKQ